MAPRRRKKPSNIWKAPNLDSTKHKTDKWEGEDEDDDVKDSWDKKSDDVKDSWDKESDDTVNVDDEDTSKGSEDSNSKKAVQRKKKKKLHEILAEKKAAKLAEEAEKRSQCMKKSFRRRSEAQNPDPGLNSIVVNYCDEWESDVDDSLLKTNSNPKNDKWKDEDGDENENVKDFWDQDDTKPTMHDDKNTTIVFTSATEQLEPNTVQDIISKLMKNPNANLLKRAKKIRKILKKNLQEIESVEKKFGFGQLKDKIFVGGIPYNMTFEEFEKEVSTWGHVTEKYLKYHGGWGTVTFDSNSNCNRFLKKESRHRVGGKKVAVKPYIVNGPEKANFFETIRKKANFLEDLFELESVMEEAKNYFDKKSEKYRDEKDFHELNKWMNDFSLGNNDRKFRKKDMNRVQKLGGIKL